MPRLAVFSISFVILACSSPRAGSQSSALPGHGAISIQIVPNPVVAQRVSGTTYDFPLDVIIRETGGRPVMITNVSADVYAIAGVHVARESYDADRVASLGYSTSVPANGELRYHFSPRKSVHDERLFGGVTAVIRVDAHDDTNSPTRATTTVTVTK